MVYWKPAEVTCDHKKDWLKIRALLADFQKRLENMVKGGDVWNSGNLCKLRIYYFVLTANNIITIIMKTNDLLV